MAIVTFDEAMRITLELAASRRKRTIDLWATQIDSGRLAEPVASAVDLPNFDRAMMDGYAIHKDDLATTTRTLQVIGDVRAGDAAQLPLTGGCAIKIRTGAAIPANTAAVVRQEWVEEQPTAIRIKRAVKAEESIQRRGEDAIKGDILLPSGWNLDGQARTVLKAAGVTSVQVYAPCRVILLCTGSELVHKARPLKAGEVYAANDAFLADCLRTLGAIVIDTIFVEDDMDNISAIIERCIDQADYLFITGGASVGDTDFAKAALRRVQGNAELPVERVWMRPGSPFVATRISATTVFALSGNPAACFVQFHALARHAVAWTLGALPQPFAVEAVLAADIILKPVKHIRAYRSTVRLEHGQLKAYPQAKQSSGSITGLSSTNAIILLDQQTYQAGDRVAVQFTTGTPC